MPSRRLAPGQGDVHFIVCDFCFQRFRPQNFRTVLQALFQRLLYLVYDLADLRAIFCRHFAHAPQNFRHGTLASQILDLQVLQFLGAGSSFQVCQRFFFQLQQHVSHTHVLPPKLSGQPRFPDFEVMARARRIVLRLRLALCGALHVDKIFQSASPFGLASWNFVAK